MSEEDLTTNIKKELEEDWLKNDMDNEHLEVLDMHVFKEEMKDEPETPDTCSNEEEEVAQLPLAVFVKEETEEQDDCLDVDDFKKYTASSSKSQGSKKEQRACIKFCVKLQKPASETLIMLREAFGGETMGRAQCYRWHARFQAGHTSLDDAKRSGRPRNDSKNLHKIPQIIREDNSLSFREMKIITGEHNHTCQRFAMQELKLHRICGKLVPRSLTFDEKKERADICLDLQTVASEDPTFISRIITCGETWFYGCHSVLKRSRCTKCRCSNSGIPWPKKIQGSLPSRSLFIVFFDVKGIVHWEFLPCTQALNAELYCEVLSRLAEAVKLKRPRHKTNWLLHHDNSPAHRAITTKQFLTSNRVTVVPHPEMSCAPDLSPWDCMLSEGLKLRMKARAIKAAAKFVAALEKDLCTLKVKDFQGAFNQVQANWELCINSQGDYIREESE